MADNVHSDVAVLEERVRIINERSEKLHSRVHILEDDQLRLGVNMEIITSKVSRIYDFIFNDNEPGKQSAQVELILIKKDVYNLQKWRDELITPLMDSLKEHLDTSKGRKDFQRAWLIAISAPILVIILGWMRDLVMYLYALAGNK